tara:strand:- start:640 stop:846 length:207 start_codon:yes stop_codon:yes gene_type:complete
MDSNNWKKELLDSRILNKKESNLLKNGAKSLTDSWWLQALYFRWKKLKGYEEPGIKNQGQIQSSFFDY